MSTLQEFLFRIAQVTLPEGCCLRRTPGFQLLIGLLLLACVATLGGCASGVGARNGRVVSDVHNNPEIALEQARQHSKKAHGSRDGEQRERHYLACARMAAAAVIEVAYADSAIALLDVCSRALLTEVLFSKRSLDPLKPLRIGGESIPFRFEGASRMHRGTYQVFPAAGSPRHAGVALVQPGFGLPVIVRTDRCSDERICRVYPPEGIFQWGTAWIDHDAQGRGSFVIADPDLYPFANIQGAPVRLAFDPSSFYYQGANRSALPRRAVFGLIGGNALRQNVGAYLLRDYDPDKIPVVMIHGLGSNPTIWGALSSQIWNDSNLRSKYQVIHIVYETDAPLLVSVRRVRAFLDEFWDTVDPDGNDPARRRIVLVGHSLGGVIARMLAVDSDLALWNAAFTVSPEALPGDTADIQGIRETFLLHPYPGVCTLVMMAAPHKGSPAASGILGRTFRSLAGRRSPEIQALRRVSMATPDAVNKGVLDSYRLLQLNSIFTLGEDHPVRRAGESLLPSPHVEYHTIAGDRHGSGGDGVVPIQSAILPHATSTTIVDANHALYANAEVLAEVLRVLEEDLKRNCDCHGERI